MLNPIAKYRRLRNTVSLWLLRRSLAGRKAGTDEWYVLQEKLSRKGGCLGETMRAVLYTHSLAKCGTDPLFLPEVKMIFPQNIELGDHVKMNRGVYITAPAKVSIGNYVGFGPYVVINSGNHIYEDPATPYMKQGKDHQPVVIEDDVWVASSVVITAGSCIGHGSILSAGSVISGKIRPMSIVAGNPARVIGRRGRPSVADLEKKLLSEKDVE